MDGHPLLAGLAIKDSPPRLLLVRPSAVAVVLIFRQNFPARQSLQTCLVGKGRPPCLRPPSASSLSSSSCILIVFVPLGTS